MNFCTYDVTSWGYVVVAGGTIIGWELGRASRRLLRRKLSGTRNR